MLRLRLRLLLGGGPRFALLPAKSPHRLFVGTLYMYEYNEEKEDEAIVLRSDHRLSAYLAFRIKLGEKASLVSTSYYQPVLDDFADLRLSSQSSLLLPITSKLKFTTVFSILYDSRAPAEVVNTTYSWTNGLKWSF